MNNVSAQLYHLTPPGLHWEHGLEKQTIRASAARAADGGDMPELNLNMISNTRASRTCCGALPSDGRQDRI